MSVLSFKRLAAKFVDKTFNDFTGSFTFQSLTKTSDGQGGYTTTWATFATVTGFIKPVSGKEMILDDHINTQNIKQFSFEHIVDITNEMRISYNGVNYNIHSIKSVQESTVWINILASEAVAT